MIEQTLCPLCKSKMKTTMGKHGAYWRCSRWGCEGTRDSQGRSKADREEEKDDEDDKFKRRYE